MRSIAIIGTGAVGGFYGARLQRAGCDVHFLLHRDYDHVRTHGLRIDSTEGDFTLPHVHAYAHAAAMPACDIVIVALKTYANSILPDVLPHVTHPESMVLLLQNGLGGEAEISRIVPQCRVFGGLSFLCSNKVGPGHIRHLDYGHIAMGAYAADGRPAGKTAAMHTLAKPFETAGIAIQLLEDLVLARWMKLTWNIPFNGLSVALDTTTDKLVRQPDTLALSEALMQEVVTGAAALGRTIPSAFVEKMLHDTIRMAPYKPSMKLDYDLGRPLETEAIYGEPLRQAAAEGVTLPKIRVLQQLLKFMEAHRPSTKGPKL